MKPVIRNIPSLLDTHNVALGDRSYVTALAVARSVAYQLPIPTSALDVPLSYFTLTFGAALRDTFSQINELTVLNTDLTMSLTKKLWLMRYNVVYDMDNVAAQNALDDIIAQGSPELPPNSKEILNKYANRGLLRRVDDILQEGMPGGVLA